MLPAAAVEAGHDSVQSVEVAVMSRNRYSAPKDDRMAAGLGPADVHVRFAEPPAAPGKCSAAGARLPAAVPRTHTASAAAKLGKRSVVSKCKAPVTAKGTAGLLVCQCVDGRAGELYDGRKY